jgi:hypothetical protein
MRATHTDRRGGPAAQLAAPFEGASWGLRLAAQLIRERARGAHRSPSAWNRIVEGYGSPRA